MHKFLLLALLVLVAAVNVKMDRYYTTACVPSAEIVEQVARACIRYGYVSSAPGLRSGGLTFSYISVH